jgi:hypothetical protein
MLKTTTTSTIILFSMKKHFARKVEKRLRIYTQNNYVMLFVISHRSHAFRSPYTRKETGLTVTLKSTRAFSYVLYITV